MACQAVEAESPAPTFREERLDRGRSEAVKYIVLIYNNPGAWEALPEDERQALMGEFDTVNKELTASGEFVGGAALADAATGKTVRVREGVPAITDGPFAEAKEQLAGYYVLDCESMERAIEIAARDPAARLWAVEVRPIMDEAGAEM
jgi:hypothetical protein